jgi:pilus assembly protein CpaF
MTRVLFGRRIVEPEGPLPPPEGAPEPPPPVVPPPPAARPEESFESPSFRPTHAAAPVASVVEQARDKMRDLLLTRIDPAGASRLSSNALRLEILRLVGEIGTEQRLQLNSREQDRLVQELLDDMVGLGPLEPLLNDDEITDILVNGPYKVYVERRGKLEFMQEVRFRDNQHVANIAQRIAAGIGRRVDEASPMADARLPDGSRVNIVFPPLALNGPTISIRKLSRRTISLDDMVRQGNLSEPLARMLEIASRSRLNVLISGGTGSGKTTLLNALSRTIGATERIITIEDAAELRLQQPHVVSMETRPPNLEGVGEVTQRDLLRNSLRMRPDRIIVGEVRGGEALDMLQAMNTGHDGSMSTVHANTPRDALARIENMVLMAGIGLPSRAIRTQIVSALDIVIQIERMRDGVRRVQSVIEVIGMEGETITTQDIFSFHYEGENRDGTLRGGFVPSRYRPHFMERVAQFGLDKRLAEILELEG